MVEHVNILVADEDPEVAAAIRVPLHEAGHACTVVTGFDEALDEAASGRYDVIVAALAMGRQDGMRVLRAARSADPNCQVIVVTSSSSAQEAVAAMAEGALTYLQMPLNPIELGAVVRRAAERVTLQRDREALHGELSRRYGFENIVGSSPQMQKVFRRITQVARTDTTVLIQGETGTGKELVARAIHYNSGRRHGRFVPVNCAGLVETILESELFGHEKGAFTGAVSARVGLFEYANHGTLFLDEVGDMPIASQMKLMRVLEYGELVRVGSNEPVHVDVRVIAATNQDLEEKISDGSFRRDLFYRLNVLRIDLPPLRQRQGDLPLLIDRYVREFSDLYDRPVSGIDPGARQIIFRYDWPGNVRELRNCIEHMIVSATGPVLSESDLPDYMVQRASGLLHEPTLTSLAGQPLEEIERLHIARTMELVEGKRERAAELLGISERTLYRKIEKYGLR
jgi:two-component system response regulator HydG